MRRRLPKHEIGSGNVRKRGLTQAGAARIMHIGHPDVSKMLRGLFRGFILERLLVFLAALGQDATIDIRQPSRRRTGSIRIAAKCSRM